MKNRRYSTSFFIGFELQRNYIVRGSDQSTLFQVACRELWLARNVFVFQDKETSSQQVIAKPKASARWAYTREVRNLVCGVSIPRWVQPSPTFAKVCVDGAWSLRGAECGGIVMNHNAHVLGCFMFMGCMADIFCRRSLKDAVGP